MPYLHLKLRFHKKLNNNDYPITFCEELKDWDGERGTYKNENGICYKSYLNHVINDDYGYKYEMIINSDINDFEVINTYVQFAFDKVKEYIEKEVNERTISFNWYQEFLNNGGYPLKGEIK